LLAVVNIEENAVVLIVMGAVFVVTFGGVVLLAYALLKGMRAQGGGAPRGGVSFDVSGQLPVSKSTFDRLAAATQAGWKTPDRTPETDAFLAGLGKTRSMLLGVSRTIALAGGVALLFVAAALFRQATPANMLLLPAGILALLGLGALLKGAVPERQIEPIDPQLLDKIRITMSSEPLTIRLDQFDMIKVAEMRRSGASLDDIARAVCPGFEALAPFEQHAVRLALEQAIESGKGTA
jgi:hypothetical protein